MTGFVRSKMTRVVVVCAVAVVCLAAFSATAEAGVGHLSVSNHSCDCVDVYYNGRYLGEVHGHGSNTFCVGDRCSSCFDVQAKEGCCRVKYRRHFSGYYSSLNICIH